MSRKLVFEDGKMYQETRDWKGNLLFRKQIGPNPTWRDILNAVSPVRYVPPVHHSPPPIRDLSKSYIRGASLLPGFKTEFDLDPDEKYLFSYKRPTLGYNSIEFTYSSMALCFDRIMDRNYKGKGCGGSHGDNFHLPQEVADVLRWKDFVSANKTWSDLYLGNKHGLSNPLYEHRPLTWKEISNMINIA